MDLSLAEIEQALAGALAEGETALDLNDDVAEMIVNEIRGFIALTGGGWPSEQRQEFIDQALVEFMTPPVSILFPVLGAARRKLWDPRRYVAWVFEQIDGDVQRLAVERDRLQRLAMIAGEPDA